MGFEFSGVLQGVPGEWDAGANPDAYQLAQVVRRHVGEELAAGPRAIARVDASAQRSSGT